MATNNPDFEHFTLRLLYKGRTLVLVSIYLKFLKLAGIQHYKNQMIPSCNFFKLAIFIIF